MKDLIRKVFSLFGIGVYRLQPAPNSSGKQPPKLEISSPLHHNSLEGLNQFYADREVVESYLDFEFYDRLIDFLRDSGTTYDGKNIADVGCGTGRLLMSLRNRFEPASVTGFEYSEAALKIARSQAQGVAFHSFDAYEGGDQQFDVVFCVEVLEHLLYPDKALSNILRMISPSGVAVLTVPNGRTDTFDGHINFWSPESWDVFVKRMCVGFSVATGLIEDKKSNFAIIRKGSE